MPDTVVKEAVRDILSLIRSRAAERPDDIALEPVQGAPVSYRVLAERVERNAAQLAAFAAGRRPRAGIVLPNGIDMAITLLSAGCAGVAIPFNPSYRSKEFESYFKDTKIDLLIVHEAGTGEAVAVAERLGLPVLRVAEGARFKNLADPSSALPPPDPDAVALVLLTSGSTGRSKAVPLTHRNVCASAGDVCRSMHLGTADRCLSMWEQYHVGGLVDLLLAPLYSGGVIISTPGFNAAEFFRLLEQKKPTWFQGVPTTLNELLVHARRIKLVPRSNSLRLVRSVAAPLPPQVMAEVQELFGKPVLQTYGMTEAGPLITSTGLAAELRKPGSVGRSCGPELRITGPDGDRAGVGVSGQISIRGPNVFSGYENDPDINAERFRDGWFFTGDIGYLDADGDMFITGRINQLINRGGEKVNPQEVDDALLVHPAVVASASFSVKHRTLGEDVSAAVVLRPDAAVTEEELRKFLGLHLAAFKIPSRIFFLDELPRNAIGKIDRLAVAEAAAASLEAKSTYIAPRNGLEAGLLQLWSIELDTSLGIEDDFRNSGGDSLSKVRILLAIEAAFGIRIDDATAELLTNVRKMAEWLAANVPGATKASQSRYIEERLPRLNAYNGVQGRDVTGAGPEIEEAAAEQRLVHCKTENEFYVTADTLILYRTPAQVLQLLDRGLPGKIPFWRFSAFKIRRRRSLVLKRLKQELSDIGAARAWQRHILSPNAYLYTDPKVPASNKTLLVGFGGNALRLMMPTYCVLDSLNPSDFDLLFVRDPSRGHYEMGVPGLGSSIEEVAAALDGIAKQNGYRHVMALGTSGGGLASICAAQLNGWDRVVSVGCDGMDSHPNLKRCLESTARSNQKAKPEIRVFYSAVVERDNDAALALLQLFPSAIGAVDRDVNQHNLLYPLYLHGQLPQFFVQHFGPR